MDIQRFEAEKRKRDFQIELNRSGDARSYASELRKLFESNWKSTSRKDLLVTNQMVTLDSRGKITESKTLKSSGVKDEDASVTNFLSSYRFPELPKSLDKLQLDIKFLSDGTMNLVEIHTPQGIESTNNFPLAKSNSDLGAYTADLQRRIKRAWFPPKGYESKRMTFVFEVDRQGQVSNLKIKESSGMVATDEAARAAITNASPFRPLPDGAPAKIKLAFTFDYKTFAGGGRAVFAD